MLDKVIAWLQVRVMVNASPGFTQTTSVTNGFSDLIILLYDYEKVKIFASNYTRDPYDPHIFIYVCYWIIYEFNDIETKFNLRDAQPI